MRYGRALWGHATGYPLRPPGEGLVTLTRTVATQALRREVELTCWTLPAVWTLHDRLVVGRSTPHVPIRGAPS